MTVGDTSTFALESAITQAFETPSWRGLGYFVIHVGGESYGIRSSGQSMLACSFDEVGRRITQRGAHRAPFAEAAAIDIANAYISSVYLDNKEEQKYFNLSEAEFTKTLFANSLVWAPDGDEAFDDGSYVLQFDVSDRVRLIAFKRPDSEVDPASLREIWLSSDVFYDILREWKGAFLDEWKLLPKHN